MSTQKQIDRLISQRAAEWIETLKAGTSDEHAAFASWVGESPRHLAEFMALLALNAELPAALKRASIDRDALLARISASVVSLPAADRLSGSRGIVRPSIWRWAAAAAVFVFAVGTVLWSRLGGDTQNFATAIGEQRTVALPDGSVMYLNAQSQARVTFEAGARDIRLMHGEAMFQVAQNSARPFRVKTRDAVVQAIGTRFNVDARESRTVVSVLEGRVRVGPHSAADESSAQPLSAGEAADVFQGGQVARHPQARVADATAWRQRQLVFSKTPLEDVVADFNRFHRTGRLVLEGVQPESHHYTGTFNADDVESFAELLKRDTDLSVEVRDGNFVIRGAE